MSDIMNSTEAKAYAAERVVTALATGEFKGLGSLARGLITDLSQPADENAKRATSTTYRTHELYLEMRDRVAKEFVINALGMGERKMTVIEASHVLARDVWLAYFDWQTPPVTQAS